MAPFTAMDMARVLTTHARVTVPYGTFTHALKTHECTPLEPGVLDVKVYGRGVGEVAEATVRGGSSILELISVTRGVRAPQRDATTRLKIEEVRE